MKFTLPFAPILLALPLLGDSIPTITLTNLTYNIPAVSPPPPPFSPKEYGVAYTGIGASGDFIMEDIVSVSSPLFYPLFITEGQVNGPFSIPGSDFYNSIFAGVSGYVIGIPGQAFFLEIFGSGELNFAPLFIPPGLTGTTAFAEPAVAVGTYTACVTPAEYTPCPNTTPIADISLALNRSTFEAGRLSNLPATL